MLDPQASRFGQAAILSGLMDLESLMACWNAIPPGKRDIPEHIDRRLARQAVQSHALTLWQAQQLLAGRTNGFRVDRYTLLELIGQGGMGRVYLARDTRLNRRVALKILAPERINNPRAVMRFQREARVGAQLQHENLVRVYDFGESSGRYFLVMEYIEGRTIGSLLSEQGPMPPATAARLVRQVALGLGHAHRKGLIHRDVNPYNIMVTHEGVAKLADLGLAMDLSESDRVTRDGATVGTFDYVAPEQARHSHSADIRSDIYSLGCTLYHMLTGHVPFPSPSLPEKLFAHQAMEATPLEQLVPGLPAGLADVVRTMMRKLPDERYGTPAQVVQALEPYIDEGPVAFRGEMGRSSSEPPRRSDSDAALPPPPAPDGATDTPASASASAPGSMTDTPGSAAAVLVPTSPRTDAARVLAATAAGAAPSAGVARAGPAVATAVAGVTPTIGSDLDDPAIPLLTPTDDVADDGPGLPIVLDLGPEMPLRSPAGRPSWSRRADASSRAGSPAPATASPTSGDADLASMRAGRRTAAAWVWWSIAAVVLAGSCLAFLAFAGNLGGWRAHPTDSPRGKPEGEDRARQPRPVAKQEPAIFIRSHGEEVAEERETPARSLKDAVKAATGRGNDVYIELRNREPLVLEDGDFIDMGSARGGLEIRAAPGIRPVIEVKMGTGRPFLTTGSAVPLRLSGLTIRVRYPTPKEAAIPTPPQPLIQAAGPLDIKACAFEVADRVRPVGCRALLMEGASLTLDRCWFLGFDAAIKVKAYGPTVTKIGQTMIVPGPGHGPGATPELRGWPLAVELLPGGVKPGVAEGKLILDHCTFEGAGFLDLTGRAGPNPLRAEIKHCAVRAEALLAWVPPKPGDRLDVDLRWEGLGNQLHILGTDWILQSSATMTPAFGLGVTDLASWSKFVFHEADPGPDRILYRTLPDVRLDPPRPQDLAIEPAEPRAVPAGADPDKVGPGGK